MKEKYEEKDQVPFTCKDQSRKKESCPRYEGAYCY